MINPPTIAPGTDVKPPNIKTGNALRAMIESAKLTSLFAPHMIPVINAMIPEIAINDRKRIERNTTVSVSPTVGGFAGYFKKGITNIVNHINPDKTSVFLTLFPSGNTFLAKRNTIPTSAAIDVPRIAPANT